MRLQNVISNRRPEFAQIGKYQALRVSHQGRLANVDPNTVDIIIVEDESTLKAILKDDVLYLKPLFYIGDTRKECDGTFNVDAPHQIVSKVDVLTKAIEEYADLDLPSDPSDRLLTKVLRYLISRKKVLKPINTRLSSIGYSFPVIEDMSIESNPLHIIKHLNAFSSQDYFSRQPIDKINICYDCNSSYLNFSECCTKCNSLDLKTEELVHHFRCAYVGPQSDFMKDEKLICPKCDHQLKHIGIDYDKPSEIHTCKSCNHSSQETKMKAKCVDCCKENELEQLVTYDIHEYRPTEKAVAKSLESTKAQSFGIQSEEEHDLLTNYGAFNMIKSHEAKRQSIANTSTFEMIMSVEHKILNGLNEGMQMAMLQELASIIKPYLKHNDLIALDRDRNINVLLIDYTSQENEVIQDTLHYNLNKMLMDNGWSNHEIISITSRSIKE